MSILSKKNRRLPLKKLMDDHGFENIKLNIGFMRADLLLTDVDSRAAWELYIEMLTRIVTQPLPDEAGDDRTALDSIYSLFPTTREILRRYGPKAVEFSKIAIPVLNQIVRPFTTKWHRLALRDAFNDDTKQAEFRRELQELQIQLTNYNRLLADIAGVEDLTDLENSKVHEDDPASET